MSWFTHGQLFYRHQLQPSTVLHTKANSVHCHLSPPADCDTPYIQKSHLTKSSLPHFQGDRMYWDGLQTWCSCGMLGQRIWNAPSSIGSTSRDVLALHEYCKDKQGLVLSSETGDCAHHNRTRATYWKTPTLQWPAASAGLISDHGFFQQNNMQHFKILNKKEYT